MTGYVLEWCSIDVLGVHTRDYTPHPDAVIVMLWPIWATLPVEFRNLLIMQAKLMKGRQ